VLIGLSMTIRPISARGNRRRFATYDLEWVPGSDPDRAKAAGFVPLALRLVGVYDGKSYRHYTSISDFLNSELTPENSGMWYYAHAGLSFLALVLS
jgi:hypothetical protein